MKTKVVKTYSVGVGNYVFDVFKWALWDAPDLREYYPDQYDWRHVITFGDEARAVDAARAIAEGLDLKEDIVAEFGE